MSETSEQDDALLPPAKVAEAFGVHEKSIRRLVEEGRIPRPVTQQPRFTRWSKLEVQDAIRAMRKRARLERAS